VLETFSVSQQLGLYAIDIARVIHKTRVSMWKFLFKHYHITTPRTASIS
jgi:hypothetical protein